jgi:hypothetical protein
MLIEHAKELIVMAIKAADQWQLLLFTGKPRPIRKTHGFTPGRFSSRGDKRHCAPYLSFDDLPGNVKIRGMSTGFPE